MSCGFICRNGRTLVSITRFIEAVACSCFSKKYLFKSFTIFYRKTPVLVYLFNNVAGLQQLFYRKPPATASGFGRDVNIKSIK